VLVSHSMMDIEQFCQRAVLLHYSDVLFQGSASEAVKHYYLLDQQERGAAIAPAGAPAENPGQSSMDDDGSFWPAPDVFRPIAGAAQVSNGWARCTGVALCDGAGRPKSAFEQGETASFFYEFELLQDIEVPIGGVVLQNDKGVIVHGKNTLQYGSDVPFQVRRGKRIRFRQDITLEIAPGEYTFTAGLATIHSYDYKQRELYLHHDLEAKIVRLCHSVNAGQFVVLLRKNKRGVQLLHHGLANLPGSCKVMIDMPARKSDNNDSGLRVVVTEYPKSGGSWLTSMLGDALQIPKRDIYVDENHKTFDVTKHPWYENTQTLGLTGSCVIKSHERPESPLIGFPAKFIHMVRDGRDVVVSKYFYEKDFCVANQLCERFDEPFDDYLRRVAAEWRDYVEAWQRTNTPVYKYEDFLQDPDGTLGKVIHDLGVEVSAPRIRSAVESNTKEKFKRSLDKTFQHNTFVRKAMAGDWKNFFGAAQIDIFKQIAGEMLICLGYEKDPDW